MRSTTLIFVLLSASIAAAIPPPIYDFCDLAVPVPATGQSSFVANNCDGENLVVDHDCGQGVTTHNPEDTYAVTIPPGHLVSILAQPLSADVILMITAECIVYGTRFTCLADADAAGVAGAETLTYANEGAADLHVFLVVDSADSASCGGYDLQIGVWPSVGEETAGWGVLKRSYR